MKRHFVSGKERKSVCKKVSDDVNEEIIEELSRQVARRGKKREEVLMPVKSTERLAGKMSKRGRIPKLTINELDSVYRSKIFEINSLLDQLPILAKESDENYLIDCWLDIKLKYSQLPKEAKAFVLPNINSAIRPFGKKFRI